MKLDICKAYHRLWIVLGNKLKNTFCLYYNHYKHTVVLFSLVNAPVAFQGKINNVLHQHLDHICIAYLDNNIIYSTLLENNRKHVQLIFAKLDEAGLYLKLSKCKLRYSGSALLALLSCWRVSKQSQTGLHNYRLARTNVPLQYPSLHQFCQKQQCQLPLRQMTELNLLRVIGLTGSGYI